MSDDQQRIAEVLERINRAWIEGRADDMSPDLDERMVLVQPGMSGRVEGADEVVDSYRKFAEAATIQSYEDSDRIVDVRGDTAVATYRFELRYELDGKAYHDTGHDLFVLARAGGEWRAVWRTMVLPPNRPR